MLPTSSKMSNQKFVEYCYEKILRRKIDDEGQLYLTNMLNSGNVSRADIMIQLLSCDEYVEKTTPMEFVPAGHFYSAIPSIEEREAFIFQDQALANEISGINLNTEKQMALLKDFKKYHDDCSFPATKTDQYRYYFINPTYSYPDAMALHCMMRHYRPRNIIEIGSGFSSCMILDTNDLYFNGEINLTFIEPSPRLLRSLIRETDNKSTLLPIKAQDLDVATFHQLEAKDILFVNSTHVSKLGSDVNKIIFEILPSLKKGVLIHFHDIFWPFQYPESWVQEGRAWNEAYILRAFLEFNDSFEILFFGDYLHRHQYQWLQENMPLYIQNTPGNLWIRKTKD